jgi:hypothetical protein
VTSTNQPQSCAEVVLQVALNGATSAPFSVTVDSPSSVASISWQDLSWQGDEPPIMTGYISNNTVVLRSTCGIPMSDIDVHEEFSSAPTACGDSRGWTDSVPQSKWGKWTTASGSNLAGMFGDQVMYGCAAGQCTPQATGPSSPLGNEANSFSPLSIFVGSQDLGKYSPVPLMMQVLYTDHGRDEAGSWQCPAR